MDEAFAIATIHLSSSGSVGIAPLPGKSGDLAGDIDKIVLWKAKHVVSLTQKAELPLHSVGEMPSALQEHQIEWWHLPIADFGVPDAATNQAWTQLSTRLHAALDAGENVLLHCMGGKGRSGMIALRLLNERGEDAATALARIRSVRPGAVETEAQLEWAARTQSPTQAKPTTGLAR